jgi:hypothetical protein
VCGGTGKVLHRGVVSDVDSMRFDVVAVCGEVVGCVLEGFRRDVCDEEAAAGAESACDCEANFADS